VNWTVSYDLCNKRRNIDGAPVVSLVSVTAYAV
jgi:hypothetical protein